jgi:hypothetical protein
MKNKKQHYIPQSYLESWCDPYVPDGFDNYVWIFDYNGESQKKKNPKNIFYQSEMYTIFDDKGNRLLHIEHGLSGLETKFAFIRNKKIAKKKTLSSEERLHVLAFVAAMNNRTLAKKNHLFEQWKQVFDLGKEFQQAFENASSEQQKAMASIGSLNKEGPSFSLDEIEEFYKNPLQTQMMPRVNVETNMYRKMTMTILTTVDEVGFITSDDPCFWFDPEAYKLPPMFQSPGLRPPTIEVTMPLSPNHMLLISHAPLPFYISIDRDQVDELNRRTRFSANEYFVVNQDYKNDHWFKKVNPPT